jgi:Amt family ammonium transporter
VKRKLGYDDSLDVFGVHAIGGIVGAIATGILVDPALGGQGVADYASQPGTLQVAPYVMSTQVIAQIWGVGVTLLLSGVVSFVLFFVIDKVIGLRPSEEAEREGLDITAHGERAYHY